MSFNNEKVAYCPSEKTNEMFVLGPDKQMNENTFDMCTEPFLGPRWLHLGDWLPGLIQDS